MTQVVPSLGMNLLEIICVLSMLSIQLFSLIPDFCNKILIRRVIVLGRLFINFKSFSVLLLLLEHEGGIRPPRLGEQLLGGVLDFLILLTAPRVN